MILGIAECQAGIDFVNEMFPDFEGMLPTSATGPQECVVVMAMEFRSQMFEMMSSIPPYSAWLQSCDMEPDYRYHRRVLKLLQWRCPPTRWWLKTPAHMGSIRALDAVYPDARFVMTHRDVATVLVSVCALMDALSTPLTDRADPIALGRFNTELWEESLRRLIGLPRRRAGRRVSRASKANAVDRRVAEAGDPRENWNEEPPPARRRSHGTGVVPVDSRIQNAPELVADRGPPLRADRCRPIEFN